MSSDALTPQDDALIEILLRKKANLNCTVCGHDHMMLVDRTSNGEFSMIEVFRAEAGANPVRFAEVHTVAIACANCGFIRQFVLDALLNEGAPTT